jgi:hypothetical protein
MESNWLDSYYEALEFFYLEPQHLRRKKQDSAELETLAKVVKKSSNQADVARHLRKMEVTLNHNISQFFLLAPDTLRNQLFKEVFARDFGSSFVMHGRGVDADFKLMNSTQPDFLFVSDAEIVSIEMKVAAKSSVDQVLKYALVGLAVELQQGRPKEHYLALLGPGDLAGQFQERFDSIDKLTDAIAGADLAAFLRNKPAHFKKQQEEERFSGIVENMRVEFLTYERFAQFLRAAAPPEIDQSPGAQVYRKLIGGLVDEFGRRGLA